MDRKKKPKDTASEQREALWFLKKSNSAIQARREVIAQELFRLILPGHPKTRLVRLSTQTQAKYIISKEVPGYSSLSAIDNKFLLERISGSYKVQPICYLLIIDPSSQETLGDSDNKITEVSAYSFERNKLPPSLHR